MDLDSEAKYHEIGGPGSDDSEEEDSEDHADLINSHRKPLVGMAATLAMLKGTGDLERKEELAGRAKDARDHDPSQKDYGVKLEYRDKDGRKLTQKEAFRQLSYDFHGYGPGKKKLEKRLKAKQAADKASSRMQETMGTMKSLVTAQEATGKAHITIEGGFNNSSSAAEMAALLAKKNAKKDQKSKKNK